MKACTSKLAREMLNSGISITKQIINKNFKVKYKNKIYNLTKCKKNDKICN